MFTVPCVWITGKVELYDLVRCLDDSGAQKADLKKRMRRIAKKDKVVDVPLNKHEMEKVGHWFAVTKYCLVAWQYFAHVHVLYSF